MELLNKEMGKCPYCGSENLDYGVLEVVDNSLYYPVTCKDCHKGFKEYHDLKFSGNYS